MSSATVPDGETDSGGAGTGGASDDGSSGPGGTTTDGDATTLTTAATTTGGPATCGDGVATGAEACDGTDFGGQGCGSFGFDSGELACTSNCTISTDGCSICGNGTMEGTEACDGADFGGDSCTDQGFLGGDLACSGDCAQIDTSGCTAPTCGDNSVNQSSEVCDGTDLGGESCSSQGFGGGTLACSQDCTQVDTTGCTNPTCGDGTVNQASEDCDGSDFDGQTCAGLGMGAGSLSCTGSCTIDTSGCMSCVDWPDPCTTDADCCPGLICDPFFGFECW